MKKYSIFIFIIFIIHFSCKNQKDTCARTLPESWNSVCIEFDHGELAENYNNIDFNQFPCLTSSQYDSLQLDKVNELEGFDPAYLSINRKVVSNDKGNIISVKLLANGQISECLISYDKDGNLIDDLTVAYEDLVEAESRIYSEMTANLITIRSIDFVYPEKEEELVGISDTVTLRYEITPDLRFLMR
ncbi:MAG: hypothetical protein LUG18_04370 [Candidatus Azobacteroides sp.]|nr:hypothetical protein [Candidatus Azobacteroides sp.]